MILDSQIEKIINNLKLEKQINITVSDEAHKILLDKSIANLSNGGRGIGNVVEDLLINPLSRYMFDHELFENAEITINSIDTEKMPSELICSEI